MGDANKNVTEARNKTQQKDYCGSCYGAGKPNTCCNTCDDVRDAYRLSGWQVSNVDEFEQVPLDQMRLNYLSSVLMKDSQN